MQLFDFEEVKYLERDTNTPIFSGTVPSEIGKGGIEELHRLSGYAAAGERGLIIVRRIAMHQLAGPAPAFTGHDCRINLFIDDDLDSGTIFFARRAAAEAAGWVSDPHFGGILNIDCHCSASMLSSRWCQHLLRKRYTSSVFTPSCTSSSALPWL